MLRSVNSLTGMMGYEMEANDGQFGRCRDFLFDDRFWMIRYLVVDTGTWLPKKKVLVSPLTLGEPDWLQRVFPVDLSREQVEASPPLDADAPVSRAYEMRWRDQIGLPYYWAPRDMPTDEQFEEECHLRSTGELTEYRVQATDGGIGHVEDFILDVEDWRIHYVVVDTRNWLPGRKVLVAPAWIGSFDWAERTATVDMDKETVRNSPKYDPAAPVSRDYEGLLCDYYGRPKYWETIAQETLF